MINELVFVGHDGQAVTNSVKVSEKFGKVHKHVLESIRKLMTAENSAVLQMFEESTYVNEQNKTQPMYLMNRDGFTLLAMGFTGAKAMKFKIDFINAFNKMESKIKQSLITLMGPVGQKFRKGSGGQCLCGVSDVVPQGIHSDWGKLNA